MQGVVVGYFFHLHRFLWFIYFNIGELTDSISFGFRATAIRKIADIGNSTFLPTLAVMKLVAEACLSSPVNIANIVELKE